MFRCVVPNKIISISTVSEVDSTYSGKENICYACVSSSFLLTTIPFVLRYNKSVLIQATLFFKVGQLTLLLPLGRGSRRNSAARADIPANDAPIHQMNSCGQEVVHYTIAFTLSVITSGPLEAWWVGLGLWRQQVAAETAGGLVEVHVWEFFTPHISCASGELQHPWASWKWLQILFAKALYVMAICLFGMWAASHAVPRCRRRMVGTAI